MRKQKKIFAFAVLGMMILKRKLQAFSAIERSTVRK